MTKRPPEPRIPGAWEYTGGKYEQAFWRWVEGMRLEERKAGRWHLGDDYITPWMRERIDAHIARYHWQRDREIRIQQFRIELSKMFPAFAEVTLRTVL
jgi:hypothetical protein